MGCVGVQVGGWPAGESVEVMRAGRRGTDWLPAWGPRTRSQKAFSAAPMKLVARQRYWPPSCSDTLARRRRATASTLSLIHDCRDKRAGSGSHEGGREQAARTVGRRAGGHPT